MRTHFVLIAFSFFNSVLVFSQPATLHNVNMGGMGPRIVLNNAISVFSGDPQNLVNLYRYTVSFDYSEMKVCDWPSLMAYLDDKTKKLPAEKAGAIMDQWEQDTKQRFEKSFIERLDERLSPFDLRVAKPGEATQMRLLVKVYELEPHVHKGTAQSLPFFYCFCSFIDPNGESQTVYELTAFGSRDNKEADRVEECYAIAGRMLGSRIFQFFERRDKALREEQH